MTNQEQIAITHIRTARQAKARQEAAEYAQEGVAMNKRMDKRAFGELERHYYAMLERFMTCPLNGGTYEKVEAEFRQVRDSYRAAQAERVGLHG